MITKLAVSKNDSVAQHFTMNVTDFKKSVEIGDGIYVWINSSTQSKLLVLNRVFKLYDADSSDLTFYLRDDSKSEEEDIGTRYEI